MFTTLVADGLGMTFEQFEERVGFIHKEIGGALVAWLLIPGHVLAAPYHHYVRKDRTLYKIIINK